MSKQNGGASWIGKVVVPVVVAVVAAIAVAALTPAGAWFRERLFPTSAVVRGVVHIRGGPAAGAEVRVYDRRPQRRIPVAPSSSTTWKVGRTPCRSMS